DVVFTQDQMPQSLGAGDESTVHSPTWAKRSVCVDLRAIKYLDGISAWIGQFEEPQNSPFLGLVLAPYSEFDIRIAEALRDRIEIVGPRDTPTHVHEVILKGILANSDSMMPVVKAEIESVGLAFVQDFHADDLGSKALPGFAILDANSNVAHLGNLRHLALHGFGCASLQDRSGFRRSPV